MNIDITKLKSGIEEYTNIDINYDFKKEQLQDTDIIELNDVKITGKIYQNYDNFNIQVNIEGVMILPCSVSLKPTKYPFFIELDEYLDENTQESLKNRSNTIDIFPIIWENILMEIPLRVVSDDLSDVKTEGDGWRLITNKEERINPELEKLKDLL